ncbi:MAG TPA: tRNA epoxyqueuosine(34) reductase QueG [Candidatus Methylomirabilis sp.]|nr:tRNA epoxyqueuosine(34) reductase QueG [Candidatus Methylomirabilis sp.]
MATLAQRIKAQGEVLGFDLVGISAVAEPPRRESFAEWLRRGYHGEMAYMARTAGQRMHPGDFLPWARSIVSVALNYNTPYPRETVQDGIRGWIARYAWGDDYHDVMQAKLERLLGFVRDQAGPEVQGRIFVDAGPVLDREAGAQAGIGWYGKNTTLLSMQVGSFFFLGELFLSLGLTPDRPIRDRCGRCRLCLDACPTNAFVGPYILDARRCISYLTIELKGAIPLELRPLVGAHVFGCDICQDVCPYNTKVKPTREAAFQPREGLHAPELIPLLELTEGDFKARFRGSPILRAKRRGFLRNICVALGNLKRPEAVTALVKTLREDPDALVRAHAAWALGQIGTEEAEAAIREAGGQEADPAVLAEIRAARRALAAVDAPCLE